MSLSGSLTAAVTGIDAQSAALGSISNNIANSQTVGYKAVGTDFSTLLTISNSQVNEPGGVISSPVYGNDIQGTVVQTGITTNLAVSGAGMFAVSQALGTSNAQALPTFAADPLFTREGDFSINNQGFLVNAAGYYLNGFAINQTTGAVEQNQLVPIQLNELESNPQATANVQYSANLPTSPAASLNNGSTTPITTVGSQTLNFNGATPPYTNGDTLTVTNGLGATTTFQFSDSSAGVPAPPNPPDVQITFDSTQPVATQTGVIASEMTAAGMPTGVDTAGNLVIGSANSMTTVATLSASNATAVTYTGAAAPTSAATVIPANIQFSPTTIHVIDAQGASHDVNVVWTKMSGTNDTYEVTYTSSDPAILAITPATPTVVQFNVKNNAVTGAAAGSVEAINGAAGGVGTPATIPLSISFAGSTPATQAVSFNLGNFGVAEQTTMFTGTDVNFESAQQDGLPPGSFTSLDINTQGNITLNFNNGATKTEFQVALVQFANFDALQPENGNAYSNTVASGTPSINSPGNNGSGTIVSSSVEGSNVDIAGQFTDLIQTQRAYEANTKVVTTVNQLLQETDQLIQ